MHRFLQILSCLAAAGSLGACATPQVATNDPNPWPPPGTVVVCDSSPPLFTSVYSSCKTVIVPAETVIRARS